MGINRTFMELKQQNHQHFSLYPYSINRTFMELKLEKITASDAGVGVLIEPLWN